jgi:hypothetical protein
VEAMKQNRLIEVMAEQIADGVGRRNAIADQLAKLASRLEVGFKLEPKDSEPLTELIARRNLFTHANGIVDSAYRTMVPGTPHQLGDKLDVTYQYWNEAQLLLRLVSTQLLLAIFGRYFPKLAVPTV